MKEMNRLMVTSDTYKQASSLDAATVSANSKIDPANDYLWSFRLTASRSRTDLGWDPGGRRHAGSGRGRPFLRHRVAGSAASRRPAEEVAVAAPPAAANRRGAYMIRGFSTSRDVVPNFLQAFDVDDGRLPCPLRTRTVTAPQGLFLMNSDEVEKASEKFAERLQKEAGGRPRSGGRPGISDRSRPALPRAARRIRP